MEFRHSLAVDQHGTGNAVRRNYVANDLAHSSPELENSIGERHRMRMPLAVVKLENIPLLCNLTAQVLLVQMERPNVEVGQLLLFGDA